MSAREGRLRVAVLGCTGSIGTQALDVCRRHADRLEVTALAANTSAPALAALAREFAVSHVALADASRAADPALDGLPEGCEAAFGDAAVAALAALDDVDCVLVSVVGAIGIRASWEALRRGKTCALANKESLVVGGDLLMPLAAPGQLLPVDSEHSAIFQCLEGRDPASLRRIWLTCSGGPFFGRDASELASVTPAQALAHPKWSMGPKITVDSATLMNKGLEVIEAHHLFGVDVDDVCVLVHPQSRIHSMVELADGSVIAQLADTDMRGPIQYALSYPERWESPMRSVDFREDGPLTFAAPDPVAFRCLGLAYEAGRAGGTMPCAMNAANEVANAAFRAGDLGFAGISEVVERVMGEHDARRVESLEQLEDVDAAARRRARELVGGVR